MIVKSAALLRQVAHDILSGLGATPAVAERVSTALVESNLAGHDSHGVMRLPFYASSIRAGKLNPAAELEVIRELPGTVLLDAGWNLGHYACAKAMTIAMDKARTQG